MVDLERMDDSDADKYQQEMCYQGCTDEGSNKDHFFCI